MRRWPDTLPPAGTEAYRLTPVDQALRTTMETGAQRARRISRARLDRVATAWRFTDAQMAVFRAWHEDAPWSLAGASDDLTGWTAGNVTLMAGPFAGPDACPTTRMLETTATGEHVVQRDLSSQVANGATVVVLATVSGVTRTRTQIGLRQKDGSTVASASFDLAAGSVVAAANGGVGSIASRGGGWWRCALVAPAGSGSSTPRMRIGAMSGSATSYAGDAAQGLDLCEVMARAQSGYDLFARTGADGRVLGAAGGAGWALMPLAFGGGLQTVEARFTGPYEARALAGLNWEVSAQLEVRNA
jgi:hypothetical protein